MVQTFFLQFNLLPRLQKDRKIPGLHIQPENLWFIFQLGCGNTMQDLSDLVPFHSGQVENFYLLVLGQVQKLIQFCISNFDKLLPAHILH